MKNKLYEVSRHAAKRKWQIMHKTPRIGAEITDKIDK
jgi:hypothetical protein